MIDFRLKIFVWWRNWAKCSYKKFLVSWTLSKWNFYNSVLHLRKISNCLVERNAINRQLRPIADNHEKLIICFLKSEITKMNRSQFITIHVKYHYASSNMYRNATSNSYDTTHPPTLVWSNEMLKILEMNRLQFNAILWWFKKLSQCIAAKNITVPNAVDLALQKI